MSRLMKSLASSMGYQIHSYISEFTGQAYACACVLLGEVYEGRVIKQKKGGSTVRGTLVEDVFEQAQETSRSLLCCLELGDRYPFLLSRGPALLVIKSEKSRNICQSAKSMAQVSTALPL